MQFGMVGRMVSGMRQVVGFGDRSTEGDNFGGGYGASHIVSNGEFAAKAVQKCVNRRSCGLG